MAVFFILIAILALLWFWLQRRKPRRNWQDDPTPDIAYGNGNNGSAATGQDVSGIVGGGGDFGGAGASGSWDSGGGDSGGGDGGSSGD